MAKKSKREKKGIKHKKTKHKTKSGKKKEHKTKKKVTKKIITGKITKKTKFSELLTKYPESARVIFKYGLHCIGCQAAAFETIEQGAKAHGMTNKQLDNMIRDLNKVISEKKIEYKRKPVPEEKSLTIEMSETQSVSEHAQKSSKKISDKPKKPEKKSFFKRLFGG